MMKLLRLAAVPALAALALAGCAEAKGADNGIATAGGASASPSAEAAGAKLSEEERRLKFAECMRGEGIDMPDPQTEGGRGERVRIRAGEGMEPEKVEAAMKVCKEFAPNGGEPIKLNPEQLEQMRKFSKCMRENGVPEFPDPQAEGGIRIRAGQGSDLDPESDEFQAAEEKCRQFRPVRPSESPR